MYRQHVPSVHVPSACMFRQCMYRQPEFTDRRLHGTALKLDDIIIIMTTCTVPKPRGGMVVSGRGQVRDRGSSSRSTEKRTMPDPTDCIPDHVVGTFLGSVEYRIRWGQNAGRRKVAFVTSHGIQTQEGTRYSTTGSWIRWGPFEDGLPMELAMTENSLSQGQSQLQTAPISLGESSLGGVSYLTCHAVDQLQLSHLTSATSDCFDAVESHDGIEDQPHRDALQVMQLALGRSHSQPEHETNDLLTDTDDTAKRRIQDMVRQYRCRQMTEYPDEIIPGAAGTNEQETSKNVVAEAAKGTYVGFSATGKELLALTYNLSSKHLRGTGRERQKETMEGEGGWLVHTHELAHKHAQDAWTCTLTVGTGRSASSAFSSRITSTRPRLAGTRCCG